MSTNHFDLIENAKDSLEHAVDHLTRTVPTAPQDLKRGILDITHVIELLLKAALYQIHPAFIWENVDTYPDEEKRTVNSEQALNRLMNLSSDVVFRPETINTIKSARKLRNQIEHFKFQINEKHAHLIIGRLLSLIFAFSTRQLKLGWEEEFRNKPNWKSLIKDVEFWNAHAPVVEERVIREKLNVIVCGSCFKKTMTIELGECLLCGQVDMLVKCVKCNGLFPESFINDLGSDDYGRDFVLCNNCFHPTPDQIARMKDFGVI